MSNDPFSCTFSNLNGLYRHFFVNILKILSNIAKPFTKQDNKQVCTHIGTDTVTPSAWVLTMTNIQKMKKIMRKKKVMRGCRKRPGMAPRQAAVSLNSAARKDTRVRMKKTNSNKMTCKLKYVFTVKPS